MWAYRIFLDSFREGGKQFKTAEEAALEFLNKKRLKPGQFTISTSVQDVDHRTYTTVHVWWLKD